MSPAEIALGVCLAAVNLLSFALMGLDKRRARRGMRRIRERTLLLSALAGGSLGAILGMAVFHHKTNKTAFSLGLPLILLCQLALVFFTNCLHLVPDLFGNRVL